MISWLEICLSFRAAFIFSIALSEAGKVRVTIDKAFLLLRLDERFTESKIWIFDNVTRGHFWSYFTYYYIEEHGYFFNHTIFCVSLSKCSVLARQIYLSEGSKSGVRLRASSPHGI